MAATKKRVYRVRFMHEGKVFELYARQVEQGSLFGFIEIADLVWGGRSEVIIDPTEDQLKHELAGVKRMMVPIHAVVRIDEVEKGGAAKIVSLPGSKDTERPVPIYTPGGRGPGKPG